MSSLPPIYCWQLRYPFPNYIPQEVIEWEKRLRKRMTLYILARGQLYR